MDGLGFDLPAGAPLSLPALLLNLAIGALLALVLRWHFERFGSTLSNRAEFAGVFPLIVTTTVLIITVVKSSLALSLGLVGALSIVRFRTPIKEPEELAYLFLAIAIGLGLGADQLVPTSVAALGILATVGVLRWRREGRENANLYLSLDWELQGDGEAPLDDINALVSQHARAADVRRVDSRDRRVEITYFLEIESTDHMAELVHELQRRFAGMGVTFIDQSQLPSV